MGVTQAVQVVKTPTKMSLLGRKPTAPMANLKPKNFQFPAHIDAYLKTAKAESGRTETEIVLFAIELDRDLAAMLASEEERIRLIGEQLGMDPERDMAKLIAALVRRGLDKAEADVGAKKRR